MRVIPAQGQNGFNFKTPYPASFGSLAGQFHLGIDILCPVGTSVVAPENGVIMQLPVTTSSHPLQGGNQVYMKGDSGIYHRLMHLSKFLVHVGQRVNVGQQIALSGNTGSATNAPHVHWDCDTKGFNTNISSKIDPNIWLKQGDDMAVSQGTANSALVAHGATNIDPKDTARLAELWTIGGADKQPEINAIFAKYGNNMAEQKLKLLKDSIRNLSQFINE